MAHRAPTVLPDPTSAFPIAPAQAAAAAATSPPPPPQATEDADMKVEATKLTAETLLAAPRRGAATPNATGKLALYTLSTHKFGDKTLKEVRVMDLEKDSSWQISDNDKVGEVNWIPGGKDDIIYFRSSGDDDKDKDKKDGESKAGEEKVKDKGKDEAKDKKDDKKDSRKGRTEVVVANGADSSKEHYVIADINAPIGNLKLKALDDGSVAFVVTGLIGPDGSLYNGEAVEKKNSARIFDSARIVNWNEFYKKERYSLWYNTLTQEDGKWKLSGDLIKLFDDEAFEVAGNYGLGEASGNYDVSTKGVAVLATDLTFKRPHEVEYSHPYYIPVESFAKSPTQKPIRITSSAKTGETGGMKISPDGSTIAYMHSEPGYVYNSQLYIAPLSSLEAENAYARYKIDAKDFDPPSGFEFAGGSDALIFSTQQRGRDVLAHLKLKGGEKPRVFFTGGSVSAFKPLKKDNWDELLVSSSSYIDSSLWQIVNVDGGDNSHKVLSSQTKDGAKFGISREMISEFWYEGANGVNIQSFMARPNDFDEKKKYPWVLFPHGGPTGAHMDAWSTRWNMAAWAEQGYVMIMPNVTGSTGFGFDLAHGINGEYGGRPFDDLVNLIKYLEGIPYLDQDKAILAGASYGGFMVSWFFGDDIIKKFCGAIWHDGVYAIPATNMQNDIIMDDGMFEGAIYPWINHAALDKWNPAKPERMAKWKNAPPTLVIHSLKDYRCPIVDGIATVHALYGHGVPTRFLTFEDEGHWVLNPENSLVWHNTVWDWIKKCINGEVKRGDAKW